MIWAMEQMMTGATVNRMIHLHSQGESSKANECLHHVLYLNTYLAAALLVLSSLCYFVLPVANWFKLNQISNSHAQQISAVIFVYMALVIFTNIVRISFSVVGRFWLGNLHQSITQVVVLLIQVFLLWQSATAHPQFLAYGILGGYVCSSCILLLLFNIYCSPYTLRWKRPTSESLTTIMADNLPLMGFTFSQSLLVQGFTISIQLALGPYYVSAFSILKTLSRTFYQGSNVILNATCPELTAAVARRDLLTISRIGRLQLAFILPTFFLFTCLALLFHRFFLSWWTHGKVSFSNQEILIFLAGVFFLTLWSKQSQLLMATLQHRVFYVVAFGLSLLYAGSVFSIKSFLGFDAFLVAASLFELCLYIISRIQGQLAKNYLHR
jgi:O-antigen/teichoic acid export membrane protein